MTAVPGQRAAATTLIASLRATTIDRYCEVGQQAVHFAAEKFDGG